MFHSKNPHAQTAFNFFETIKNYLDFKAFIVFVQLGTRQYFFAMRQERQSINSYYFFASSPICREK